MSARRLESPRVLPVLSLLLVTLLATPLLARSAKTGSEQKAGQKSASDAARDYFTDTVLINQDGEEMRFYSDLVEDKVVVINVLFTECSGSCPIMSQKYRSIQEHLGDRLGREVNLISISVDPKTDSPARLKQHAEKFGARHGWYLLTGSTESVKKVLGRLGQWVDEPESHQNVFLIGNDRTGLWKKAFGLAPTEELVSIVESVIEDPGGRPSP